MPLTVQVEAKTREKGRLTCYQFSTTMIMIRMPNSNATLRVARCFHWVQLNQRHTRILLASALSMATKVPQCACLLVPTLGGPGIVYPQGERTFKCGSDKTFLLTESLGDLRSETLPNQCLFELSICELL
jgi:hypothetical protein